VNSIIRVVRPRINEIAEGWKDAYFKDGKWSDAFVSWPPPTPSSPARKSPQMVYDDLLAAGTNILLINSIIGNETWTSITCSACGQYRKMTLRLGDNESDICVECIKDAAAFLNDIVIV
jgi:hypothetical protein